MAADYKSKYLEAQAQSDRNFARYEKRKEQSDKNFSRYQREQQRAEDNDEVISKLNQKIRELQAEVVSLKVASSSKNTNSANSTVIDKRSSVVILGLSTGFSKQELKEAYARLVNRYHPDKHMHMPSDFIAATESEFKKIKSAYEKLK